MNWVNSKKSIVFVSLFSKDGIFFRGFSARWYSNRHYFFMLKNYFYFKGIKKPRWLVEVFKNFMIILSWNIFNPNIRISISCHLDIRIRSTTFYSCLAPDCNICNLFHWKFFNFMFCKCKYFLIVSPNLFLIFFITNWVSNRIIFYRHKKSHR